MKIRTTFGIMALCFLAACGQSSRVEIQVPEHVAIEKGQALFDAFNAHNWQQMAALYSEDAVFLDPSLGAVPVRQSRDSIVAKYTALHNLIPDIADSIARIAPIDTNGLLVEFVTKGTLPDGQLLRLPIVSVLTFKQGLIVADHTYYDNSGGE